MKFNLIILTTACLATAVPAMGSLDQLVFGNLGSRLIVKRPPVKVLDKDCIVKDYVSGATVVHKPSVTVVPPQKVITFRPPEIGPIVSRVASLGGYVHHVTKGKTVAISDLVSSLLPSATIVQEEVVVPKVYEYVHEPEIVAPTLVHRDESRVVVPGYYFHHDVVAPSVHHEHQHHVTTVYSQPEIYSSQEHRVIVPSTYYTEPEIVSPHVVHREHSILATPSFHEHHEHEGSAPVIASIAQPTVSIVGPSMNVYQQSSNNAGSTGGGVP